MIQYVKDLLEWVKKAKGDADTNIQPMEEALRKATQDYDAVSLGATSLANDLYRDVQDNQKAISMGAVKAAQNAQQQAAALDKHGKQLMDRIQAENSGVTDEQKRAAEAAIAETHAKMKKVMAEENMSEDLKNQKIEFLNKQLRDNLGKDLAGVEAAGRSEESLG